MPGVVKKSAHGAPDPSTSSPEMLPMHDSPEQELPAPKRAKHAGVHSSGAGQHFKAGSILRIRMQNFMTYDDISYDFGPALNMIIGPNGSGKSTVVAGICLGLGFDPKIMGRAEKVEATIKHGTQTAKIEIELKGYDSGPNVFITRQFGHGSNGSKGQNDWLINGKKTTHKIVQETVRAFNCQIDNLCQFLPQDKVASFARMKPVEMLAETMRTVGDGSMGQLHEELITLQSRYNSEMSTRKLDEEKLSGLKSRQEVLERDVARFREREANKKEIHIREKRLPFARYNQAKAAYTEAKAQYNLSKARLIELRRANQPLEAQETALVEEFETLEQQTTRLQEREDAALRRVERCALVLKDAEETMTHLQNKFKQEREAEKNNKVRIRELRERVARETRSLGEEPIVEDEIATLIQQIRDLNTLERQHKDEAQVLQLYLNTEKDNRKRREDDIEQRDRELASLDDVRAARYNMLKQRNVDAAEAIQWLEQNQNEFEHRVYGPVLMEVQVINKKFARAAQHVIMQNAFTFTCQSRKDYQTFNRLLVDGRSAGRRLRLNVAEYSRTSAPQLRDQRSPLTQEEVKEFGFDGYLLDCLDGPDAVLNTLCHAAQINSLPIGTAQLSQEDIQRIENATKNNRAVFQRYILGATDTKIFRGYGQVSSESQAIHNDGSVFSHVVDSGRKKQLEDEIEELRESLNSEVPTLRTKSEELNQVREQLRGIEGEKRGINAQRAELQKRKSNWQAARTKAEQTKEELDRIENAPADYQDNMAAIRAEQIANTISLTEQTVKYKDAINDAQVIIEKHIVSASAQIQAKANKESFDTHNSLVQAELRDLENDVNSGKAAKDRSLRYAHEIHRQATEAVAELSEDEKDLVSNYDPETTVEDLELQIEDFKNRLTFFADTDGNVLDNYEARAREIEALQKSLDEKHESLAEMNAGIENRRRVLESQLEEMRGQIDESFGEAFRSIQCLGEIRISRPADFALWALEIWVQFRDTDSLQMLTGERQSGGERSVSTIFYLMALQSLSIAPFRVVDEINQGMDPRNERRVHARMVEIACETATSQYFLITPKLLTDLDYHPNMKVHCVTSGNLGRTGNKIGYSKYLAALRMRKTQSQASQVVN